MYIQSWASQVALIVKNPPANAGEARNVDLIPGSGRSPGEEMATNTTVLAWKIQGTEELCRVQFTGLQRIGHE